MLWMKTLDTRADISGGHSYCVKSSGSLCINICHVTQECLQKVIPGFNLPERKKFKEVGSWGQRGG